MGTDASKHPDRGWVTALSYESLNAAYQNLCSALVHRTNELAKLNKAILRRNFKLKRLRQLLTQALWHQAFCAWCDNRALDEPVEEIEKKYRRPTCTTWLCNKCALELVDALDSMVRQHCYGSAPCDGERVLYDSGALRANCEAMELLIRNKSMCQDGERVGRRMFAKFMP